MAVNKVIYNTESGERVLIDLTNDTVNPDVLKQGVITHNSAGEKITGTMPDNGSINKILDASNISYNIPKGYHNGSGNVSIDVATIDEINDYFGTNAKLDTSDATATASDILLNKTAYVNGDKITGTMLNQGDVSEILDTSTISYTIPQGYHNGSGNVQISLEQKSVTPMKSQQIVNPSSGKVLSEITVGAIPDNYIDTSDADATISNIQNGKTAYVNGAKITGTLITQSYYTGNSEPDSSLGSDDDLYLIV